MPEQNEEMKRLLLAEGWQNNPKKSPWEWHQPQFPGAWYLLRDAYVVAKATKRLKIAKIAN